MLVATFTYIYFDIAFMVAHFVLCPSYPSKSCVLSVFLGRSIRAGNVRRPGTLPADKPVFFSEVYHPQFEVSFFLRTSRSMVHYVCSLHMFSSLYLQSHPPKQTNDNMLIGDDSVCYHQVRFAQTSLMDACPFKVGHYARGWDGWWLCHLTQCFQDAHAQTHPHTHV